MSIANDLVAKNREAELSQTAEPLAILPSNSTPKDSIWRRWNGPLTEDLIRTPGEFGLGQVPARLKPDATTSMICGFCSTGCSLNIHLRNGEAINMTPALNYPVNIGMACPKGWESLNVLSATDRATTPLQKIENGRRVPIDWPSALKLFCERFKKIQAEHGPESVAFLSTGQITTEEMALLGSLAKFGMGMIHGDGNTRQCMATSVVSYKESFGFDAPPYTYQDFEESDVIVLIGANLCIAHPILWQRVLRNPHKPEIIVVDPRKTETAMAATLHLQLQPKADLALLYGIAHILIRENWIDREYIAKHTNHFEDFAKHVELFTPEYVSQLSGISIAQLERTAELIHNGKRVSFWWTMGVNQSYQGVRTAQAIINLSLMTGNIGRPGSGANSITGQCNAMGSRLFSNTTNMLGGRDFTKAEHREHVARILEIDPQKIPQQGSWAYNEIIEGVLRGKIRGLWIIATNPAHSWINQHMLRDVLDRLDFLVVQDMYHSTETAEIADLVLPAAAWGEKDGTLINSERRIGVIKKVAKAPGQALSDFNIFRLIAQEWGCGDMFSKWTSPEAAFNILRELSRGQPCDITGITDYEMIDRSGGIQWPCIEGSSAAENPHIENQRRLFFDGKFYHVDGRAKFIFADPRPMPEPTTSAYPYILLTGRGTAAQWHTQTRTKKSSVLRKLYPQYAYVEINPADARRENIRPDQTVVISSQRGSVVATAFLTPTVTAGQLFIPMHYATVNQLTDAQFDPYSKQPSYKACAVRIRAANGQETPHS